MNPCTSTDFVYIWAGESCYKLNDDLNIFEITYYITTNLLHLHFSISTTKRNNKRPVCRTYPSLDIYHRWSTIHLQNSLFFRTAIDRTPRSHPATRIFWPPTARLCAEKRNLLPSMTPAPPSPPVQNGHHLQFSEALESPWWWEGSSPPVPDAVVIIHHHRFPENIIRGGWNDICRGICRGRFRCLSQLKIIVCRSQPPIQINF